MIDSDFTFCQQVDSGNFLEGFTYIVDLDRFAWDSKLIADKVKRILNCALCSVEGCAEDPFKINETEKKIYCENHWRASLRNLEGVSISIQDMYQDLERIFMTLEKELIYIQERVAFMKKFKQHLRSYKENNEVVEQKIDQINLDKFTPF